MKVAFSDNGKQYKGEVIADYGRSVLVMVDVDVKHGRKDFSATDDLGSTVQVERLCITEVYND